MKEYPKNNWGKHTNNMAKIIFRLPTDKQEHHINFMKSFEAEAVSVPEDVKILIKNEAGYWKEVGRKRIKLGELEIEE